MIFRMEVEKGKGEIIGPVGVCTVWSFAEALHLMPEGSTPSSPFLSH